MVSRLTQPEVKYGLIAIIWILNTFQAYLAYREWKLLKKTTALPDNRLGYSEETLSKARGLGMNERSLYMTFLIVNVVEYSVSCIVLVVGFELIPQLYMMSTSMLGHLQHEPNEMIAGAFLVVCLTAIDFIFKLPFDLFEKFVILKRYDMNQHLTLGRYLLTTFVVYLIVNGVLDFLNVIVITYVEELGGKYYSVFLWLMDLVGASFLHIIVMNVAPLVLNMRDFRPLPPGELRDSVKQLADSVDFAFQDIYISTPEASRVGSAFFFGIGNYKAIVLSDRLFTEMDNKEILALVAHELGHWRDNHVLATFTNEQVYSFFSYMTAQYILSLDVVYEAFKMPHSNESRPTGVGIFVVFYYIFVPVDFAFELVQNYLSRRHEYQADAFVALAGLRDSFQSAMIKLSKRDLEFPIADPLFSALTMDHPTLTERLKRLYREDPSKTQRPPPRPNPA